MTKFNDDFIKEVKDHWIENKLPDLDRDQKEEVGIDFE